MTRPSLSQQLRSGAAVLAVVAVGLALALAGSDYGARVSGFPAYAIAVAVAFVTQWAVFVPSFLRQTERFFDLTGSLTFITVTIGMLVLAAPGSRGWLLGAMVMIWAGRLGTFLVSRIRRYGHDDRFDALKPSFLSFLGVWTLQGLWVSFTAGAAWIAMTSSTRREIDALAVMGAVVWAAGLVIEIVADEQKRRFKRDAANDGQFIATGLWSRSRHPNYFGEIVAWLGVAIVAAPAFTGWQWVGVLSPIFVAVLLTRISGVPLLEEKADARWGGQPAYESYKQRTPVLIPSPREAASDQRTGTSHAA